MPKSEKQAHVTFSKNLEKRAEVLLLKSRLITVFGYSLVELRAELSSILEAADERAELLCREYGRQKVYEHG